MLQQDAVLEERTGTVLFWIRFPSPWYYCSVMSEACALIYSESYQDYSFSPWHPMKPERLMLSAELMRSFGLFERDNIGTVEPRLASDEELALVHERG